MSSPTMQRPHRRPSLKRNALSNWVVLCVNILIGFFLTPVIVKHLDENSFGMWMLVSSILGYFGLLRLGVGTSVLRYVPLYRGGSDKERVDAVASAGLAFYIGVGVVIIAVSTIFAGAISDFFDGGSKFATLIRVIGLASALECSFLLFDSLMRGYESFVIANAITILNAVVRALGLLGCVLMGYGVVYMGWVLVIVTVSALMVSIIAVRIYCPDMTISFKAIEFSSFKLLLSFGVFDAIISVANLLTFDSPKIITGKTVSMQAVGLFGVAVMLMQYYRHAVYAITRVFMPRFSYLAGSNAEGEIRRLFIKGSRYATAIAGAVALLLWAVGPSFLRIWLTTRFEDVVPALAILTAGTLVLVSHRMSVDLLYGLGKQKYLSIISIIEGVGVLVLAVLLSFKYGITGVAIGAAIPSIFIHGLVKARYVCKVIKVSFWNYYFECLIKPWAICIGLALMGYWFGVTQYIKNWPSLFVVSFAMILVYGLAVYAVVFEAEERQQMNRYISTVFNLSHKGSRA